MDRIKLPPEPIRRRIEALNQTPPVRARWTRACRGLSEDTVWRLEGGSQTLAVRCWRINDYKLQLIRQLRRVLSWTCKEGLAFVAAPIGEPIHDGEGGLWEMAPWKSGSPLSELSEDSSAVEEAVKGLVQWHVVARRLSDPPSWFPRGMQLRRYRLKQLDTIAQEIPWLVDDRVAARWPELTPLVRGRCQAAERAAQAIRSIDWSQATSQMIHGDARPEHFLIENGELTGLIDFGAMRRDTPWADLARLAGELGPGRIEEVVSLYEQASGQPVDRAAVAALDLAGAAVSSANWSRWLSDPSRHWPDPELVRQRLRSISSRLAAGGFGPA
ncbi:Phosphotransferase enzyme family protein [Planctomycetes bacterium MalM25]|nr:Phosphotransferase enzyme family protein [Planctomycetes bacterium MalM25]